jgi:glycine/D-amino acid oxidase-like deaminating enzyme
MRTFDYLVIGGGLTGLIIARKLSQSGADVGLVEAESSIGGSHHPAWLAKNKIENGLRFLPKHDLLIKALTQLETELNFPLIKNIKPVQQKTYEAAGFRDFLGFGEKAPAFYDQIKHFLSTDEIELTIPIYELMEKLAAGFTGEILTRNIVTRFVSAPDDAGGSKNLITQVTVNGSKTIHAKNFVFCGPVRDLALLLEDDQISLRAKAKLKKSAYWMAVQLDLVHQNPVVDNDHLYLLNGTTDDEIGPCVGRFFNLQLEGEPTNSHHQLSQWISFIDFDSSEEAENYGEVLKKMKRQIKRAFPESLEQLVAERISVSPALTAGELKLNANGTLATAQNLWIASPSLNAFPNLTGAFLQSQFILSSLGFGHWVDTTELPAL